MYTLQKIQALADISMPFVFGISILVGAGIVDRNFENQITIAEMQRIHIQNRDKILEASKRLSTQICSTGKRPQYVVKYEPTIFPYTKVISEIKYSCVKHKDK